MLHQNILFIRDESALGDVVNQLQLSFEKVEVTVRDIITERVYQEVEKYNTKAEQYRYSLVKPTEHEDLLNQSLKAKKPKVNPEVQVAIALEAFASNGFFMLVNDMQVESLDQIVVITADTIVSFVKLTPLVGG